MERLTSSRRATLADVASTAGVSTQTASNAFSHPARLRPTTLAVVRAAAEQVGFAPNLAARALRGTKPQLLVLGVPDLSSPYLRALASTFDADSWRSGFLTQIICMGDGEQRLDALTSLLRFGARGLLVRWADGDRSGAAAITADLAEWRIPSAGDLGSGAILGGAMAAFLVERAGAA